MKLLTDFIARRRAASPNGPSTFASTVADEQRAAGMVLGPPPDPTSHDEAPDDRPIDQLPTIGHIGRYALKYRLGEGGLGTVHAAHDPLLSRAIAVKMLHVDVPAEHRAALEASFLQEARAAAGLNHPHIVTVHDAGASEQGLYIAMERLKGADLRQLLQQGWRPTSEQAVAIVRRAADALAYAHGKGVVHCDVKPANIFMVGRTWPKLLDFGIARVAQGPEGQPHSAFAAGSPHYMAPEQLRGEPLDRRTDVHALGVVLYELLSGVRPYTGATLEDITDAVLQREPMPLETLRPDLSPALAAIAHRALAKDPARRFRSARHLSQALRLWLAEQPLPAPPAVRASGRERAAWSAVAAGVVAIVAGAWWPSLQDEVRAGTAADGAPPAVDSRRVPVVAAAPGPTPAPSVQPVPAMAEPAASIALPPAVAPTTRDGMAHSPRPSSAGETATLPAGTRPGRERNARDARAAPRSATAAAATGVLQLAISPWGEVEVDGRGAGTTPPVTRLTLPEGTHTVTVRNADFPAFSATVRISAGEPVTLKHRFGS